MHGMHFNTKSLIALVASVSLGAGVAACGSSGKDTSSAARASSNTTTAANIATSASTTPKRHPGEDNDNLRTIGNAATEPDRREITALVKRFYVAAAADDGAAACKLYTAAMARAIPEDYGHVPGLPGLRGNTCAVVASKLFEHPPDVSAADLASTRVIGVRDTGKHGFAELSSKGMPLGEIGVEREGDSWRIAATIGSVN